MTRSMIVIQWRKHAKRVKMEHPAADQVLGTIVSSPLVNSKAPWNLPAVVRTRAALVKISNQRILITRSGNLMIPCGQFRNRESKDPFKNLKKAVKSLRKSWWHYHRGNSKWTHRSEEANTLNVKLPTPLETPPTTSTLDNLQDLYLQPEEDFQIYATRTK